jgi:hypothetical protein
MSGSASASERLPPLMCGICKGIGLILWRWWWHTLVTCPMCGGDGVAKLKPRPRASTFKGP